MVRRILRRIVPPGIRRAIRARLVAAPHVAPPVIPPAAPPVVPVENKEIVPPRTREMGDVFSEVYDSGIWGRRGSRSGFGSDLKQTAIIQVEVPKLLNEFEVRSLLDIPCGDFFWMREVDLAIEQYIGADVVSELIKANQSDFGNETREFRRLDLSRDSLPSVDMILSRDVLVHFSFADIVSAIDNIRRSGARYFLTTTFTDPRDNIDIHTGEWRALNLQRAPLNFPEPLRLITEGCTEAGGDFADKCLGLWRVADLPDLRSRL